MGTPVNRPATPAKSRNRILLAESDDLLHDLISRWLGEAGYEVLDPSMHHGLTLQLLIIDVANPRSIVSRLRALTKMHPAPILMLSARIHPSLQGNGTTAALLGAQRVLAKPFSRSELLKAVNELIPLRE